MQLRKKRKNIENAVILPRKVETKDVAAVLYRSHLRLLHELEVPQFALPLVDVHSLLLARRRVDSLSFPAGETLLSHANLPPDDVPLLAHRALGRNTGALVDEFHAAGFAGPVLFVAVGAKASPLVVAASKDLLVVEAHGGRYVFQVRAVRRCRCRRFGGRLMEEEESMGMCLEID